MRCIVLLSKSAQQKGEDMALELVVVLVVARWVLEVVVGIELVVVLVVTGVVLEVVVDIEFFNSVLFVTFCVLFVVGGVFEVKVFPVGQAHSYLE